jgi:hypothetical protein
VGELAVGELAVGELAVGELAEIELAVGELAVRKMYYLFFVFCCSACFGSMEATTLGCFRADSKPTEINS